MLLKRRSFLQSSAALGAAVWLPEARAAGKRVVIVGGGWGGLAAARQLRLLAPEFDVTLIEQEERFWSCPLSNKWLIGQLDEGLLVRDTTATAAGLGYRLVRAKAESIDRISRQVATTAGSFGYDWLVLSLGIRHDYAAWFGEDEESAQLCRQRYPAAYTSGNDFLPLRDRLLRFTGGDWLITVPPAPFRCPPAIFERAALMAGWFEQRNIPGRIVIIDPNPPFQEFQRLFREHYPQRVVYRSQTPIKTVDLRKRLVRTEFEDFGFDDAILLPPQQAGDLAWQAGLIGRKSDGSPSGWAAADPLTLAAKDDPRVFMIGDMIDRVSNIFGHYPKSGQIAVRQGQQVARRIVAAARGENAPLSLPDSICHIATRFNPPAAIRLHFTHRLRGDGELIQHAKTERDPQPRGEDIDWLKAMYAEMFATPA